MEKISKTKSSCTMASDYYIDDDGSVTKMKTNNCYSQIYSFIVNENDSNTKKILPKNVIKKHLKISY